MQDNRFLTAFIPGLCLAVGFVLAANPLCAATPNSLQDSVSLPKNVAPWLSHARKVGTANDAKSVRIAVYLTLRNQAQLTALIDQQSTPGSPQYQKYLSPEEFRAQFAPAPADVQKVEDTLTGLGFSIVSKPASGLFVVASGTVAQVKSAFHVSQNLYSYKGKTLRANSEAPVLPPGLGSVVTYIAGLDETRTLVKPFHHLAIRDARSPDAAPGTGSRPISPCMTYWGDHLSTLSPADPAYGGIFGFGVCGYDPQQLRAAYGADRTGQTGQGVRVAVVDAYASPTIVNDVNTFSQRHGLPQLDSTNFVQLIPAGIYNVPENPSYCGGAQGWYGEETLDLEMLHTTAPNASLVYAGAEDCGSSLNETLYNLIDNRLADIIVSSWGDGTDDIPAAGILADTSQFLQAAVEGITVVFASGDSGDLAATNTVASGSWPATSPYVTAVGGTSLALRSSSGDKEEWGWGTYITLLHGWQISNDSVTYTQGMDPYAYYAGGGGGLSLTQPEPAYQAGIVPNKLATTTQLSNGVIMPVGQARRVTPDIAMVGDPYTGVLTGETYTISGNPAVDSGCTQLSSTTEYCERSVGGTSVSAPLFAGVLAMVAQQRAGNSSGPLGLLNPRLYRLSVGAIGSAAAIFDISAPSQPVALLAHGLDSVNLGIATVNSVPDAKFNLIQGVDTSLVTAPGYDNVTGLGVPNVPVFVQALGGGQ
jgi:subtilase family serine protease